MLLYIEKLYFKQSHLFYGLNQIHTSVLKAECEVFSCRLIPLRLTLFSLVLGGKRMAAKHVRNVNGRM